MPKLNAKKITVKKMTAADLAKRLDEGKDLNFKETFGAVSRGDHAGTGNIREANVL